MRLNFYRPNIPCLLTSEQAADVLKVSMERVQRWARSGRLKSYRAGRRLRFTEQAIREFVGLPSGDEGATGASPASPGTVSGESDPFDKALTALEERLAQDLKRTISKNQPPGVPTRWEAPNPKAAREASATLRRALTKGGFSR